MCEIKIKCKIKWRECIWTSFFEVNVNEYIRMVGIISYDTHTNETHT